MGIRGLFGTFLALIASSVEASVIFTDPVVRTETPICGRGDFCNMEIRTHADVGTPGIIYSSRILACRCQDGVTCPTQWGAHDRAVFKHVHNSAENMSMTISYCEPFSNVSLRTCRLNEEVLTLRGYDIPFRLQNRVRCNCTRKKLFISHSRTNGTESIKTYTCGKPLCDSNRTNRTPCVRVFARENPIADNGPLYEEEHPCRCRFRNRVTRRKQECFLNPHNVPQRVGQPAGNGYCRSITRLDE